MEYTRSLGFVSLPCLKEICLITFPVAVDVNIYASHPKHARPLIGNHENTEVGNFIRDYLDLNLEVVTKELKERGDLLDSQSNGAESWMGKPLSEDVNTEEMDHYHGEFKRSLELEHQHLH